MGGRYLEPICDFGVDFADALYSIVQGSDGVAGLEMGLQNGDNSNVQSQQWLVLVLANAERGPDAPVFPGIPF